jgi:hypothetical protein
MANKTYIDPNGRFDQSGTDSSGTPGAATINKPSGISSFVAATATVVITNSLATTTSRIMITPYGDMGTFYVTRAAGSFTVTRSTTTGTPSFGWTVSALL